MPNPPDVYFLISQNGLIQRGSENTDAFAHNIAFSHQQALHLIHRKPCVPATQQERHLVSATCKCWTFV